MRILATAKACQVTSLYPRLPCEGGASSIVDTCSRNTKSKAENKLDLKEGSKRGLPDPFSKSVDLNCPIPESVTKYLSRSQIQIWSSVSDIFLQCSALSIYESVSRDWCFKFQLRSATAARCLCNTWPKTRKTIAAKAVVRMGQPTIQLSKTSSSEKPSKNKEPSSFWRLAQWNHRKSSPWQTETKGFLLVRWDWQLWWWS